jgi:hypothetical protein
MGVEVVQVVEDLQRSLPGLPSLPRVACCVIGIGEVRQGGGFVQADAELTE